LYISLMAESSERLQAIEEPFPFWNGQ
jgi:hypothetical protein